jgi:hypothetical protein
VNLREARKSSCFSAALFGRGLRAGDALLLFLLGDSGDIGPVFILGDAIVTGLVGILPENFIVLGSMSRLSQLGT